MYYKEPNNPPMTVILGIQTIKAFVAHPKELKVLGIVRFGMEFGLLSVMESGSYVRVNGSTIEPLRTEDVERALSTAVNRGRVEPRTASFKQDVNFAPSVVIRKRKRFPVFSSV